MDFLAKKLSEKVGITEEQAEEAIEFVLDFVKDKLPDKFAPIIDHLLDEDEEGEDSDESDFDLEDAANLIGGLFKKKKDD